MSDYNIDDILAEIDRKRGSSRPENYESSVTEILDSSKISSELNKSAPVAPSGDSEPAFAARQLTEEESSQRRSRDISEAADRSRSDRAPRLEKQREERDSEAISRKEEKKPKKERMRLFEPKKRAQTPPVNEAAQEAAAPSGQSEPQEQHELHEPQEHTGFTAELSSPADAQSLFAEPEQPESEFVQPFVKPQVSGDDDIIFHTRSDLVTTDTQQMRKMQRIEEINAALLKADRDAESPDELLDSLNPMDSRAKAAEELKSMAESDIGDTLAVAGNDLKRMAAGEDRVKEYSPAASRKKPAEKRADDVLFSSAGGRQHSSKPAPTPQGNDGFVEELTGILRKEREKKAASQPTVTLSDLSAPAAGAGEPLNIDYEKQLIDTSVLGGAAEAPSGGDDTVDEVKRINDLAAKKQASIKDFIIENIESSVDDDEYDGDDDDYDEEEIDLDDESVIAERLNRASKGLWGRLVILLICAAAALFIALSNQFSLNLGFVTEIISKTVHPDYYLAAYLTIGILSFVACSSVITSGFSRIARLRPDQDTLCAMAHIAAIVAVIPYLSNMEYIQRGRSHVYLLVSLCALIFNTASKLCTVYAAKRNFMFTSGDSAKYVVQINESDGAEKLAKGAVTGLPTVASTRKTEMLCDFIISTYCEEISDRIARIIAPVTFGAALVVGLMAYFMGESDYLMNNLSWAATAASCIFSVGAAFSGSMIVSLPMLGASRTLTGRGAAVLGYNAVDNFSDVNAILVEAKTLFPATSVKINNMWNYHNHHSSSSQEIPLDQAIIMAASLAVTSDSVLSDAFFGMLKYKTTLLKPVSNCVYESNLGVMGWIDRRRVLLGNREHMKSHQIVVPDKKKEDAANKNGDEVIYLAVGGEVCMLFFVQLTSNPKVKQNVKNLEKNGVSLVIKTVDGMITDGVIADLFDISPEHVKIIPFESHEEFSENTKFISKGSAAVSCDGTFSAFAAAINGAKALREKISFGCIMQIAGISLGILLTIIFTVFTNYGMFNCFFVLLYNIAWMLLTFAVQAFKRI